MNIESKEGRVARLVHDTHGLCVDWEFVPRQYRLARIELARQVLETYPDEQEAIKECHRQLFASHAP